MKERFIWFLSITRKFGFLMAFAMIFPYLAHVPALKASDGVDELLPHEVSMSELEEEYQRINLRQIEIDLLVKNLKLNYMKTGW